MMKLLESLLIGWGFGVMFAIIFFAVALYVIWSIIVFVFGLIIALIKIAFVGFVLFFIIRWVYCKVTSKEQVIE